MQYWRQFDDQIVMFSKIPASSFSMRCKWIIRERHNLGLAAIAAKEKWRRNSSWFLLQMKFLVFLIHFVHREAPSPLPIALYGILFVTIKSSGFPSTKPGVTRDRPCRTKFARLGTLTVLFLETSLLHRLQAQTLADATSQLGKILPVC